MSLKSGCNSTFNYADYIAEFGLNSKMSHLIQQKITNLRENTLVLTKNSSKNQPLKKLFFLAYWRFSRFSNSIFINFGTILGASWVMFSMMVRKNLVVKGTVSIRYVWILRWRNLND